MNNLTNELTVCEIRKWVKDLFQGTDIIIPDLEESYDCMKLISNIICINKEAEKDAQEIIKTESHFSDFYQKKGEETFNTLAEILSTKDLAADICENVKKIAGVAILMKLKEPTVTNFLLGSADLDNKKESLTEQEIINGFNLSRFSKKITDIMQKNMTLESDIAVLEKKVLKQHNVNFNEKSKFFTVKADEYKRRIKRSEKHLKGLGWNPSLSHSELVKRSEAVQSFETAVNNLATKLELYEDLPPNEMLIQFKLEEAKTELLRLQKEFQKLL